MASSLLNRIHNMLLLIFFALWIRDLSALVMAQAAAGLLLYWITSNIWAVAQHRYFNPKQPHLEQFQMPPEVHRNEKVR